MSTNDPGRTGRSGLAGMITDSVFDRNIAGDGVARAVVATGGLVAAGASTLPRAAWKKARWAATRASLTARGPV
jgi:hypothetical protein